MEDDKEEERVGGSDRCGKCIILSAFCRSSTCAWSTIRSVDLVARCP